MRTQVKTENYAAGLRGLFTKRTIEKLKREPVEDFRIDFEDGYGFRSDAEEDAHADFRFRRAGKIFSGKNNYAVLRLSH